MNLQMDDLQAIYLVHSKLIGYTKSAVTQIDCCSETFGN